MHACMKYTCAHASGHSDLADRDLFRCVSSRLLLASPLCAPLRAPCCVSLCAHSPPSSSTSPQPHHTSCSSDSTAGSTTSAANCGTAPATSQSCSIPHCYSYIYGSWGGCTPTSSCAATGTQTRSSQCWDTTSNIAASSGNCAGSPTTSQSCSLPNCYSWHSSAWGACGPSCGASGSQSRSNTC